MGGTGLYSIAAQLVGFVGMALCIGCFQCKNSTRLLLLQALGNGVYIIHYLMLGAYSGCLSLALLSLNNIILMFGILGRAWAKWKGWKWLFSVLTGLSCALTWAGPVGLLPNAANIVLIWANWSCNGKVMRLGKLCFVGPGWIAYNLYAHSYSGILSESIGMCSALVSILRYRKQDGGKQANGK